MAKKKGGSVKAVDDVLVTSVSMTADVTGVLPTANGGTGTGAPAVGDTLVGAAGPSWARRAIGAAGQVPVVNPGGTDWAWTTSGAGGVVDPVQQSYSPGSFVVATEKYAILSRHLKLTGAQRVQLQGTATLRIT